MKVIKERVLFLKGSLENINSVGSITPSSRAVGKAMTRCMDTYQKSPRRILEVGAGTGPITAYIVKKLRPGDQLDVYEINPEYVRFLETRFENEESFKRVKDQVRLFAEGAEKIERVPTYDIIISAIPFTAFPADSVAGFFETYREIIKPDGVLSYIEYALSRSFLTLLARGEDKSRLQSIAQVVSDYHHQYEIDRQFVPLNMPPANIYSLQFD